MKFENLICDRDGAVLTVTMNRPTKLNSLSLGLLRDLAACADAIGQEPSIRAVILTGAGRGFCAGADLTDPESPLGPGESLGQHVAHRLCNFFHPVLIKWTTLRAPVVVAVNGIAAGAGVSLALSGDITLAAHSASFAVLFAPKLGLVPDMGATHLLPTRIGVARARYLALTGEAINATRAEQIGLIADVIADEQLPARAAALAAQLAAGPTKAFLAVRELLADATSRPLGEQIQREADTQHRMADSADFLEGITAFREKRAARFQGR